MSGSAWGIVWLAIALKIPIVALLYIVWWAATRAHTRAAARRTRRAAARTAHRSRAHQRAFALPSAHGACPRAIAARPLPAVTFAP
jgi:hypothetical protein